MNDITIYDILDNTLHEEIESYDGDLYIKCIVVLNGKFYLVHWVRNIYEFSESYILDVKDVSFLEHIRTDTYIYKDDSKVYNFYESSNLSQGQ